MHVNYRVATFADLSNIVSVHCECFQGYFLTSLGKTLLYRYYEQFMIENNELFIVAVEKDRIVGFVMGYFTGSHARADFEKKNKFFLAIRMIYLCAIFNKEAYRRVFLKTRSFFKRQKPSPVSAVDPKEATLLSICMHPDYQGGGRAAEMVREFEKILLKHNKHVYVLSVKNYNTRGVRFYEKLGFSAQRASDKEITFIKSI